MNNIICLGINMTGAVAAAGEAVVGVRSSIFSGNLQNKKLCFDIKEVYHPGYTDKAILVKSDGQDAKIYF